MEVAHYRLSGNVLQITGGLDWPLDVRFDIELRLLLDDAAALNSQNAVIDLRGLESIASQYIGALRAVASTMKKNGGVLAIRAKENIGRILQECGLDRTASLEIE